MSLQSKIKQIGTALSNALGSNVHHYFRPDGECPSCVWQEAGEDLSFYASNIKQEQTIRGTVDYYTQTEFDANADIIQTALQSIGAAWVLESVQYEAETKMIHYEWSWSVRSDGVEQPVTSQS